jgi:pre-mRNA-splicing factor SYF1
MSYGDEFEDALRTNPYQVKLWFRYFEASTNENSTMMSKFILYERALTFLPRSFKIWHCYLNEMDSYLIDRSVTAPEYDSLLDAYERALVYMNKMPRIWIMYCTLLTRLKRGSQTRKTFDRALQSLPITQHKDLWEAYIEWAKSFGVGKTTIRIFRRYLMYNPSYREAYIDYLKEIEEYGEAAVQISYFIDAEDFVSESGKSKHSFWMELCNLCATHPLQICNLLKVETIIRAGIATFSDEVGRLWCRLADYYIRLGQFEKARDTFEEAIATVTTVRDFSVVFDAYVKVEESILVSKMQLMESRDDNNPNNNNGSEDTDLAREVDMRMSRMEYLLDRRPLSLNSVVLRQNPHNVNEWLNRALLYKGNNKKIVATLYEGIDAVDMSISSGKSSLLWITLATHYNNEENDLEKARSTWKQATQVPFKHVDELANVYCGWAEMEMRLECYTEALEVMQQAVKEPRSSRDQRSGRAIAQGRGVRSEEYFDGILAMDKVYKNAKVWGLYLDLEEAIGSVDTCRAAYDRCMELKVITVQMCLNYALYLEEHKYFEDSFRVYERAVDMFSFPHVKVVWITYIDKFIERYQGSRMERLRDLFEQSVEHVPPEDAALFFIKYAKAEEELGTARRAVPVYDRATQRVPADSRLTMYRLYIKKIEANFGAMKTRPAYERAVNELDDDNVPKICIDFAEMETGLKEVQRARAIYKHGAQFCNPQREGWYWGRWKGFEEKYGNEDTFRDLLREQRSIETSFSQVNYAALDVVRSKAQEKEEAAKGEDGKGNKGEGKSEGVMAQFVAASGINSTENEKRGGGDKRKHDSADDGDNKKARRIEDEEVNIDDDIDVSIMQVPDGVFGSA